MKTLLLNEIKKAIKSWDKDGIYAVSLFVYNDNDNPCEPTVTLGYNTEEQYLDAKDDAYDAREARWNYAFWLQNEEYVFGYDKQSKKLVKQWLDQNGFPYYSESEIDFDKIDDEGLDSITKAFVDVLIDVVKTLHASGFIKEQFGKPVPILIHELEYYEEIAKQNVEANSKELVKDFVAFCREG